jgi:hypothetical protein
MNFKGFNSFIGWLLMHRDGILHIKKQKPLNKLYRMGLNQATKRVLKKMENAPNVIIPADLLLKIFREERN